MAGSDTRRRAAARILRVLGFGCATPVLWLGYVWSVLAFVVWNVDPCTGRLTTEPAALAEDGWWLALVPLAGLAAAALARLAVGSWWAGAFLLAGPAFPLAPIVLDRGSTCGSDPPADWALFLEPVLLGVGGVTAFAIWVVGMARLATR